VASLFHNTRGDMECAAQGYSDGHTWRYGDYVVLVISRDMDKDDCVYKEIG